MTAEFFVVVVVQFFEPDEISIITRYDTWVNLTEEICGDDMYDVH